jgi:hypothetical protein
LQLGTRQGKSAQPFSCSARRPYSSSPSSVGETSGCWPTRLSSTAWGCLVVHGFARAPSLPRFESSGIDTREKAWACGFSRRYISYVEISRMPSQRQRFCTAVTICRDSLSTWGCRLVLNARRDRHSHAVINRQPSIGAARIVVAGLAPWAFNLANGEMVQLRPEGQLPLLAAIIKQPIVGAFDLALATVADHPRRMMS